MRGAGGAALPGAGAGDLDRVGLAALGKKPFPLALTDPELLGDIGLGVGLIR